MSHASQDTISTTWQVRIGSYLGMLNMGILNGALGPLLVQISDHYQLELAGTGLPVLLDGAGYLLGTILISFVWRIYRARLILGLSSLALFLTLVGIVPFHYRFGLFLVLLFSLGFSFGFLSVALDCLFSEIHRRNRAKYLNILHFFFGLGSFAGPLLFVVILNATHRWVLFYLFSGLCHIPLLFFFAHGRNFEGYPNKTPSPGHPVPERRPFSFGIFWAIILAMFLHLGVEVSYSAWMPVFLTSVRNMSATTASYSVASFWFAFLLGRGLFSRISHRIDLSLSLFVGTGGAAVCMGLTFLTTGIGPILLSAAAAGFLLSFVYPNLLALAAGIFPRHIGFVTGMLSASGGLGYMFFPWLIGPVSQSLGLTKGVFMIPLLGFGMAGILAHIRNSEKNESG